MQSLPQLNMLGHYNLIPCFPQPTHMQFLYHMVLFIVYTVTFLFIIHHTWDDTAVLQNVKNDIIQQVGSYWADMCTIVWNNHSNTPSIQQPQCQGCSQYQYTIANTYTFWKV